MSFFERIAARSESINSLLCVGLDPHPSELGAHYHDDADGDGGDGDGDRGGGDGELEGERRRAEAAYRFCARIVDATHPHAVCYKPNAAFFEALGHRHGMTTLRRVIERIGALDGDVPVLLDVKRGDIGTTAEAYADACYDDGTADGGGGLGADGVTLSPLMGWDSVRPFVTGECADGRRWGATPRHIFRRRRFLHLSLSLVDDYRHICYS
jgi:orotidine 5'-phosphate decarboxylase subfamily 2